tara:strand:+ start:2521 stop:3390 length:870 start_codon:yes stop_codon:yes gene_type:complete
MHKICFISDFFADQVDGGGELNDWELVSILNEQGHEVQRKRSHEVTEKTVKELSKSGHKFIVSNFCNLSLQCRDLLASRGEYVIYEHDHKYILTRNPMGYPDFKVPKEEIINRDFYASAKAVFCQTNFHMEILKKNLQIDNLISLSGNLWSEEHLDLLEKLSKIDKEDSYAVVNYTTTHKNTQGSIRYCLAKNLKYDLIELCSPQKFLKKLGKNKTLVFFPKSPETLSRILLESRMMNMSAITTKNIGAVHEDWFPKKGAELIELMRSKRKEIPRRVSEAFYEDITDHQ